MNGTELPIRLRPATLEDRFFIRRHLTNAAARAWCGSLASAEASVTLALDSPSALPRIFERDDKPLGYAHAIEVGLLAEELPKELAAGTWHIDLFFLAREHSEKGLEETALALLAAEVFGTTLATACSAFVSIRNEDSARSYERAGFHWLRIWSVETCGPCWLMMKERPPAR